MKDSKDCIWVVEVKYPDVNWWMPRSATHESREGARSTARAISDIGYRTRVRKYQRVGK